MKSEEWRRCVEEVMDEEVEVELIVRFGKSSSKELRMGVEDVMRVMIEGEFGGDGGDGRKIELRVEGGEWEVEVEEELGDGRKIELN